MRTLTVLIFFLIAVTTALAQQPTIKWVVEGPRRIRNLDIPYPPFSEERGISINHSYKIDLFPVLPLIFFLTDQLSLRHAAIDGE